MQPKINPAAPAILGIWILWGFGYGTVWSRYDIQIDGDIVSSRDVPSTGAPRYATEYVIRGKDKREQMYVAGATDASIERSLPVGMHLVKKWGQLDYEVNGRRVDFPITFYGLMLGIAAAALLWAMLLFRYRSKD